MTLTLLKTAPLTHLTSQNTFLTPQIGLHSMRRSPPVNIFLNYQAQQIYLDIFAAFRNISPHLYDRMHPERFTAELADP
jgi:hypothetical protein